MHRTTTRFRLIVAVAVLAVAKVAAQQEPSAAGQNLQPKTGDEEAAIKRVVDGIMQPYLAGSGSDRRGFGARPSLFLHVWKSY